ncbi:hypothetical protein [Agrobacterium tumefaciens]|uniref:hypothetical protein n=1 Tax=Agrobacterium tumefaciens TaxID=358 RepID=UPI0027834F28|nr:hypothetical protein [Agrobacterium tumefaciens]MDP9854548.1 hypothetical protein [Agrobacterium tumefaciens]
MSGVYLVQSFTRARKGGIVPDIPIQTSTADNAERLAARLAETKSFVIATSNVCGEVHVLLALGNVPDGVLDA